MRRRQEEDGTRTKGTLARGAARHERGLELGTLADRGTLADIRTRMRWKVDEEDGGGGGR